MLYKWRKDYDKFGIGSFPGKGTLKQTPEQKIISDLEAKLKEAELEGGILKKAVVYFFKERSMIFDFIKNHEKIFLIKKCVKFYRLVKVFTTVGKTILFPIEFKK